MKTIHLCILIGVITQIAFTMIFVLGGRLESACVKVISLIILLLGAAPTVWLSVVSRNLWSVVRIALLLSVSLVIINQSIGLLLFNGLMKDVVILSIYYVYITLLQVVAACCFYAGLVVVAHLLARCFISRLGCAQGGAVR